MLNCDSLVRRFDLFFFSFMDISNFYVMGLQGRPKGVMPKYSLKPLVPRLSELLGVKVFFIYVFFFYI